MVLPVTLYLFSVLTLPACDWFRFTHQLYMTSLILLHLTLPFTLPEVVTAKSAKAPEKMMCLDDETLSFLGLTGIIFRGKIAVKLPRGFSSAPSLTRRPGVLPSGMPGFEVRRTLRYGDLQVFRPGENSICCWVVEVVFWGIKVTSQINAKSLRIF